MTAGSTEGTENVNDTGTEIEGDTGAAQNTENEPISSADAAGTWDYTITRTEESTTYSFERGPQIVMPASWGSQVTVMDEGDHVSFYHTASLLES